MFLSYFLESLKRWLECPSQWQQLPPGVDPSLSLLLSSFLENTKHSAVPAFQHSATFFSSGEPANSPLPTYTQVGFISPSSKGGSMTQAWPLNLLELMIGSRMTRGPNQRQGDAMVFCWACWGRCRLLFTKLELVAAILPIHGISLCNQLAKNKTKRRRIVTSFRPLRPPNSRKQPVPELFSLVNQYTFFFYSLNQLNRVVNWSQES